MMRDISLHKTSLRGLRPVNEDVEKYNMNLSIRGNPIDEKFAPVDFFIICDGHGGLEVAQYVVPKLEIQFMKKNLDYPLSHKYIRKIFGRIQEELKNHPRQIAYDCGCTALIVIRYMDEKGDKNIQVVNLGDCRAVLSRKGLAIPLTKDHKPFWPDEKRRIDLVNKKCGTNLKIHFEAGDWRIGDLSVSRSFGDLDNIPYVTHVPDVYHYRLMDGDEFIIMACDGLWDVISNHEAVNFVRDHLGNNHTEFYQIQGTLTSRSDVNVELFYDSNFLGKSSRSSTKQRNIARKLAEYSIMKGSCDNVSIMIIFFK